MEFEFDEDEDSPYPEVRASVSNVDDTEMPALTIRMWVIGLFLTLASGCANLFFNFRQPAPSIVSNVLILLAHPLGKLFALTLPIRVFRLPRWLGGYEFSLNPGPWNIKEHALVFIMANVSIGVPTALNAVVVAEIYYGVKLGYGFNALLILTTQLTGFSLAGLCRRFLVWPASMVWPQNLIVCTLLNTLHAEEEDARGGVSRFRFFCYACVGSFFYFFLPGFLFQALSIFSFVCWIKPNDIVVNQLFGVSGGLGMSVLVFDWSQISWIASPLMVPWWAQVQVFLGFFIVYWVLCPILYYTNSWDLSYFPIMSNDLYDRFGDKYDVRRVLTANNEFNQTQYEEYSPLFLPASYAITYLIAFALASAVVVHTVLYHGRTVIRGFTQVRTEKDDIHAKLMRAYPEVPDWWYLLSFLACFGLAILTAELWHTGIPVWALIIAIALPAVYLVPSGYVFAMTGQSIGINLIAQIIPGMILPGKPIPNMIFKAYATQTLAEGSQFVGDLKLGHYIKLPPRATFIVQMTSTAFVGLLQVAVKEWMFANIEDICQTDQKDFLTCPHNQVIYTTSVIWGLIGPARQFGASSIYHPQLYAIIIGAVLPLPFWYWQRRWPNRYVQYINTPVILNGVGLIPPATGINYSSWFLAGFIFQYLVRRRNFGWWSKFNYILSSALDCGTVLAVLFIFFTLQFPNGGVNLEWWGNTVYTETADFKRLPLRSPPAGGIVPS
ncbi:OPT oligopeptide transporter [Epithele typhae]|uniref:OPT oligopeptide transporter n=1 Tax=Epithele typhae TaxID=378194 RepID=UPI002007EC1A|nr:OPT oligopeptide transporter [Epithele typhae]KAH9942142.1 OPT oligopeptide transporter [Epithele typhae]